MLGLPTRMSRYLGQSVMGMKPLLEEEIWIYVAEYEFVCS